MTMVRGCEVVVGKKNYVGVVISFEQVGERKNT